MLWIYQNSLSIPENFTRFGGIPYDRYLTNTKSERPALFLDEDTVGRHLNEYLTQCKLSNVSGGSTSKLNEQQSQELIAYLKANTYDNAYKIMDHVLKTYGVSYSHSGILHWLDQGSFQLSVGVEVNDIKG